MRRFLHALLFAALAVAAFVPDAVAQKTPPAAGDIAFAELPAEAREVIGRIRKNGPFEHAKDGTVFGNREARLPRHKRGYYREYTVKTPGERTRGARRIVAGTGGEFYYTADHYNSFRRVRE